MNYDPNAQLFYRCLNWLRKLFGKPKKIYMTDKQWKQYLDGGLTVPWPKLLLTNYDLFVVMFNCN